MRILLTATLLCVLVQVTSCAAWLPAEREQALEQRLAHSSTIHAVRGVFWGDYTALAESIVRVPPAEAQYSQQAWGRLRE